MKKLLFGLVATIMLSVTGNTQTKEEIELLSITKLEKINNTNQLFLDFYKISDFKPLNNDVVLDEQNIELLSLKKTTQALRFRTSNKSLNNANPLYSATAAVHCHGCIKKWWPCPKAYQDFLGGN